MQYRGIEITLYEQRDHNSMTGKDIMVWVWKSDCGRGQKNDREKAIVQAKKFIDHILDDPDSIF